MAKISKIEIKSTPADYINSLNRPSQLIFFYYKNPKTFNFKKFETSQIKFWQKKEKKKESKLTLEPNANRLYQSKDQSQIHFI